MRSAYAVLAAVVAASALAGCASQGSTGAHAGDATPSAGAVEKPAHSPRAPKGAHQVAGGCGGTPLYQGKGPAWTAEAGIGSLTMPYALSDNGNVAAFLFGHPLQAPEPEDHNNKILWVMRLPRERQPLHITGHPTHASEPTFEQTQPANSGPGQIYPSLVTAPEPGCWQLTLRWNGHVDTIDLRYAAGRTQSPSGR